MFSTSQGRLKQMYQLRLLSHTCKGAAPMSTTALQMSVVLRRKAVLPGRSQ